MLPTPSAHRTRDPLAAGHVLAFLPMRKRCIPTGNAPYWRFQTIKTMLLNLSDYSRLRSHMLTAIRGPRCTVRFFQPMR